MINWDVVAALYNSYLSYLLLLLALLMFYISFRGFKSKNRYGGSSTMVCGIIFVFFGVYNQFIGLFKYPFNGFMVWWLGILLSIYIPFGLYIKKKIKHLKNAIPANSDENEANKSLSAQLVKYITKENPYRDEIPLRMGYFRKSFHLMGFLFILGYFGFFFPFSIFFDAFHFIKNYLYLQKIFSNSIFKQP